MKALLLTTNTGGGHNAAAAALREALEARGVTCRVMDCVAFAGAWVSRVVSGSYVRMVQVTPNSFGHIYRLAAAVSTPRMKSPVYAINASYAFRMRKVLEEFQPDMVACTHLFGGQTMTYLKRHGAYKGLLAFVMTDYTFIPFQEDVQADLLFVSHRDVLEGCREKGMRQETLRAFGIPVSIHCKPCMDKRAAKVAAGMDPDKREVVLVGGSMGAGNLPNTIDCLLPAMDEEDHLTVVCGSNAKAKAAAEERYGDNPQVTVLGRVSPLYPLMAACDVLVTKSGGLTSTEAMTVGVPMVIYHPIRGCETANAALFERHGLALWPKNGEELCDRVASLLQNAAAREAMIACQRREIDAQAAAHTAEEMIAYCKGKEGDTNDQIGG